MSTDFSTLSTHIYFYYLVTVTVTVWSRTFCVTVTRTVRWTVTRTTRNRAYIVIGRKPFRFVYRTTESTFFLIPMKNRVKSEAVHGRFAYLFRDCPRDSPADAYFWNFSSRSALIFFSEKPLAPGTSYLPFSGIVFRRGIKY